MNAPVVAIHLEYTQIFPNNPTEPVEPWEISVWKPFLKSCTFCREPGTYPQSSSSRVRRRCPGCCWGSWGCFPGWCWGVQRSPWCSTRRSEASSPDPSPTSRTGSCTAWGGSPRWPAGDEVLSDSIVHLRLPRVTAALEPHKIITFILWLSIVQQTLIMSNSTVSFSSLKFQVTFDLNNRDYLSYMVLYTYSDSLTSCAHIIQSIVSLNWLKGGISLQHVLIIDDIIFRCQCKIKIISS